MGPLIKALKQEIEKNKNNNFFESVDFRDPKSATDGVFRGKWYHWMEKKWRNQKINVSLQMCTYPFIKMTYHIYRANKIMPINIPVFVKLQNYT